MMPLNIRAVLFGLAVFVTIVHTDAENSDEQSAVGGGAAELVDEEDKRGQIMRYGRGSVFRYGKRGNIMRYGRGSVFRYGKRDGDDEDMDLDAAAAYKRLFRYGKRDGAEEFLEEDKRPVFRYGKRSALDDIKRRVFRYGKRSGGYDFDDEEDLEDSLSNDKRVFRYGKRADLDDLLLEEAKRRIFRYGRDTRAPQAPHVPFRFGEKEE